MVTRLFLAGDSSPEPRIAENAKTLTKAIIDINAYFKLSNLASLLEVINFYSTASTPSEYVGLFHIELWNHQYKSITSLVMTLTV